MSADPVALLVALEEMPGYSLKRSPPARRSRQDARKAPRPGAFLRRRCGAVRHPTAMRPPSGAGSLLLGALQGGDLD